MSIVRMERAGPNVPRAVMGEVREDIWTTIAADLDGKVQPEEIGKRRYRRRVLFAFKDQAEVWMDEHERQGWERAFGPAPCATAYFGETDSPSNCWSAEVEREDD